MKAHQHRTLFCITNYAGVAKSADATDLKVRQGQSPIRGNLKPCGRGEIGRRNGLKRNLSARREIGDVELLKVGETCNMAIPSQARPKLAGKV